MNTCGGYGYYNPMGSYMGGYTGSMVGGGMNRSRGWWFWAGRLLGRGARRHDRQRHRVIHWLGARFKPGWRRLQLLVFLS